ncbi:MAG: hypothetical protein KDC46_11750 [Thermoleophilia bacterium]|nr:hypothetical protein [Thermoleophilia bacterium]
MGDLDFSEHVELPSGGQLRAHGGGATTTSVLLVGGGTRESRPGRWSTSMTWLAPRVADAVGSDARIAQVRYRDSSWNRIELAVADVRAAIAHEHDAAGAARSVVLVALSMGGATCAANVREPGVAGLVAMAPWFPRELPLDDLALVPLRVVHGQLDNALPFVPGTSRRLSREAVDRARELGGDATWRGLGLGLHGLAVRWRGRTWVLPRARAFARVLARDAAELAAEASSGQARATGCRERG